MCAHGCSHACRSSCSHSIHVTAWSLRLHIVHGWTPSTLQLGVERTRAALCAHADVLQALCLLPNPCVNGVIWIQSRAHATFAQELSHYLLAKTCSKKTTMADGVMHKTKQSTHLQPLKGPSREKLTSLIDSLNRRFLAKATQTVHYEFCISTPHLLLYVGTARHSRYDVLMHACIKVHCTCMHKKTCVQLKAFTPAPKCDI